MKTGFSLTYVHRDDVHAYITDSLITFQQEHATDWSHFLSQSICDTTARRIHGFPHLHPDLVEAMLFVATWKEVTTTVHAAQSQCRYFLTQDVHGYTDRIALHADLPDTFFANPVILDVRSHVLESGISRGMTVSRALGLMLASHCDASYQSSTSLYLCIDATGRPTLSWYDPTVSIYLDVPEGGLLSSGGVITVEEAFQLGIRTLQLIQR